MCSLMVACYAGHLNIIQLLCDKGADWTKRDRGGTLHDFSHSVYPDANLKALNGLNINTLSEIKLILITEISCY